MAARRKDPMGDLDGDDSHTEKLVEQVKEKENEVLDSSDKPDPVISLDEPDDEPDDAEQSESRDGKKRRRGEEWRDAQAAREERDRAYELVKSTLEFQRSQTPQQQPAGADPMAQYSEAFRRERDILAREGSFLQQNPRRTQQEVDDYNKRVAEYEDRQAQFNAFRALRAAGYQPPQQEHPAITEGRRRFPDLAGDPTMFQRLLARHHDAVLSGKPDNWDTATVVANQLRAERDGKQRKPDPILRTALAGHSRGAGGGGGGRSFTMTAEHRKNAEAMFDKAKDPQTGKFLSKTQIYERYARKVGPEILKAQTGKVSDE